MKKLYSTSLLIILLLSCGTRINYLGNTYKPTDKVDVYVDESAIQRGYAIIGKGYVKGDLFTKPMDIQTKAISTARIKGADAVLIKDIIKPASSGIHTYMRSDSVGKSLITTGTSSINQDVSTEFIVLFLKYND
jgi:hypothetical protein